MKKWNARIVVAAIVLFAAAGASAQPTVEFAAVGSTSMYLEMGQAAASSLGCVWTTTSKTVIQPRDSRVGGGTVELSTAWVAWSPGVGSCATPAPGSVVYVYMDADSMIGIRCFFASPRCTISATVTAGTAGANALPHFTDTAIPSTVVTALNGALINAAATDIRPEDAKFSNLRAFTTCGTPVVSGSQYLGLGYGTGTTGVGTAIKGSTHQTNGSGGTSNLFDFNLEGSDPITGNALPGTFTVTPVGAVPIVVFVNPSDEAGFGSLQVTNINRATLAGYLDGTYGRTTDATPQTYSSSSEPSTVYLREPNSGASNVMEYSIPDNLENQSSQEIGLAAIATFNAGNLFPPFNCTSTGGTWLASQNPLNETDERGSAISYRERAISSSNELKAVESTTDSLGYAFWNITDFSGATAENLRYLTVDGIDPIRQNWNDGYVPTTGNGHLNEVTMEHVKDGSYPIWSMLRIVTDASGIGLTAAQSLATTAAYFLSPTQPDFVPAVEMSTVRSHFAPPGVNFPSSASQDLGPNTPANGTSSGTPEAGGDVGGLVFSLQADTDYNLDNGVVTGNTGRRQ
jgi:hypothetical protein